MARGTELAVGYVSLVAETSQLSRGINQALGQAGRDAQSQGTRMGQAMGRGATRGFAFRPQQALSPGIAAAEQTGRQMGQRMGSGMVGQLKQFMTASGLAATGILGATAALGAGMAVAVRSTVDFQTNLNRLQGASQATAAQMAEVSARAQQLGNDTKLTGTSAQDAAAAMTELVKGGLSVSQAMQAARGTLQLATAAQIDAASAATIQANALNAFNLSADQASKVADVLANVANASTGEMSDFALGLQAGGAVMNQFGIGVEDAATTLGLLANAGIASSDAGTLVKSMLLAIASPSEEAAGAMTDLGLRVWDANGNFIGMRATLEQLQNAAARMTPEMYAMATSTAFGSDAARLAGIAATQGGEGFDKMRQDVVKLGGAARNAEANTQGLPGVFERLSNTADRAKLALGGLISGPVGAVGNAISSGINNALDSMEGGVDGSIGALFETGKQALPVIADIARSLVDVAGTLGGAAWTGLSTVLMAAVQAGSTLMPILEGIGGLVGSQTGLLATLAGAWAFHRFATPGMTRLNDAMQTQVTRVGNATTALGQFVQGQTRSLELSRTSSVQMGRWGTAIASIGDHVPAINNMQQAFYRGATDAQRFGRTIGVASAAMAGMRSAASGLVGMLGGPWGAAIAAATVGLTLISSASAENTQRTIALEDAQGKLTASYREMFEELGRSGGVTNQSVITEATEQVDILQGRLDALRKGAGAGDWLKSIFAPKDADPFKAIGDTMAKQGAAENVERIKAAMNDLGTTSQQMGVLITGSSQAWDTWAARARNAGDGGQQLLAEMQPLRDEFLRNQEAAQNLTPGIIKLSDSVKVLGDNTSTAADKSNALKTALDVLAGKQPDVAAAQKTYNDTMRATGEAAQEVIDKSKGFGDVLVGQNGAVDTATENGSKLYDRLQQIYTATRDVAAAGGDLQAAYAGNTIQFQQLASQLGLTEEQVRTMAEAMGLVPQRIDTLVTVNKDDTVQDLAVVKAEIESLPPNTPVTIDALTEEAETKLESVGIKVERLPDNKGVVVHTEGVENVNSQLQSIINTMLGVPSEMVLSSAFHQLGDFDRGSFATPGDAQRARQGQPYAPPSSGGAGSAAGAGGFFAYDPSQPREEGGSINGPGAIGQDSVPIMAAPGEHMWTDEEVRAVGGQSAMYQLRAMARRGLLQGFENGGALQDMMGGGGQGRGFTPEQLRLMKFQAVKSGIPIEGGNFNPNIALDTSTTSFAAPTTVDKNSYLWGDIAKMGVVGGKIGKGNPFHNKRFDPFVKPPQGGGIGKAGDPWRIPGFEEGGAIGAVDPRVLAIDAAYRTSGRPYDYGPWDCSMYMSTIYGAMSGAGPGRHFTTESDFEALGFKKGFKPGALNIGIRRGGGGANSHMAGTLPNGVNVENSSMGSVYGPGASGASDFPLQYYYDGPVPEGLDMVSNPTGQPQLPGVPGSPGGASQGQRDAAAAGTAHGTLGGAAPGDPAMAGLAGESSTGDARTEGLIPAGAGNTAPAGGGLIGGLAGMGAQAINGMIDMAAQAGAMGANAFAPGSGMAVQMGAEAAKRGVEYGAEMIGIWGDALIEQITPFGAPRWMSDVNPTAFMPQPRGGTVATTTQEKGAQAAADQMTEAAAPPMPPPGTHTGTGIPPGPIAPAAPTGTPAPGTGPGGAPLGPPPGPPGVGSTPNAAAAAGAVGAPPPGAPPPDPNMLRLPFGIFDSGGVLAPNSVAANLGTTPEMVLTQDQWDSVTNGVAAAPLDPAQQSLDFSTHIDNVTTTNVDELKRSLDSRGRLAMMRYSGRLK